MPDQLSGEGGSAPDAPEALLPPPEKRARTLPATGTSTQSTQVTPALTSERSVTSSRQLRLVTWNVASYRSASTALLKYVHEANPDIICLQETKLQANATPGPFLLPQYRYKTWFCSTARKGYSGTAVLSKLKPQSVHRGIPGHPEHDAEGRCIVYEYPDLVLVNVYVPNSGLRSCERLAYRVQEWDSALRDYLRQLAATRRSIILCGDMNVALDDRDVYSVEACRGCAGFTSDERESFRRTLSEAGLVDAFMALHGNEATPRFTFWDYRDSMGGVRRNGWRIDLFCVSAAMVGQGRTPRQVLRHNDASAEACTADTSPQSMATESVWKVVQVRPRPDIYGSDHCPVEMVLACVPDAEASAAFSQPLVNVPERRESAERSSPVRTDDDASGCCPERGDSDKADPECPGVKQS